MPGNFTLGTALKRIGSWYSSGMHRMVLDIDDDNSIWIVCDCGWEKNIGFRPEAFVVEIVGRAHTERTVEASPV